MKNFTYKSLLKYTFCFLSFLTMNCISKGIPFALALLPAFLSLPFSCFVVTVIFSGISFIFFKPILALYLTLSAIFLSAIFYLYKRKNKKVKGELVLYFTIALLPYILANFKGSIYTKLVYSAIIYAFAIICTLGFKVIFIGKFKKKNKPYQLAGLYLTVIIFSLGLIEILGVLAYEIIAITVTFFLCRFYKNQTAFIPAFILPIAISLYTNSLTPLAIFEIYCAVILLFLKRSLLISAIALTLTQLAVKYLSGELFTFTAVDYIITFIPTVIFLFAPEKLISLLKKKALLFEENKVTKELINYERANLSLKLNELSLIFSDIEHTLNEFDNMVLSNENLTQKIIDECLLNVCALCPFYVDCTKKGHPKNSDLLKLINIGISKEKVSLIDLSRDFSSYCYSVNNMLYEINRLISIYLKRSETIEQTLKIKKLTSMQAGGIAIVLKNVATDLSTKIEFNEEKEKTVFNALAQNGIVTNQIIILKNEVHVLFPLDQKIIYSFVSKIISQIIGIDMRLFSKTEIYGGVYAIFCKSPLFDAIFGVAQLPKDGSAVSGDCHALTKINEGCFLVSLCDGMGSGDKAKQNSQTAINLFETLYKSGLPRESSLDLANKILSVCSEDSFSTLDCAVFDLYNGNCDCIKIGATYGFLLSENSIKIIENDSLPLGVLDEINPNLSSFKVNDGDTIILMSDGISDAFFSSSDTIDFIESQINRNPQTLANSILNHALEKYSYVAKDDMTVIAVKLFKAS